MNTIAQTIYNRACDLNMSIAALCRDANVSRSWFENFKRRVPCSVKSYMRIDRRLSELENGRKSKSNNRVIQRPCAKINKEDRK